MFLIDTHVHTAESSSCGQTPGAKQVEYYKANGYDGIVITDHFLPGTSYLQKSDDFTWQDCLDRHQAGWKEAKKHETADFRVYYGMEIRFKGSDNDYLVFGASREFFEAHEELCDKVGVQYFSDLVRETGGIALYQAHPFRNGMMITNPKLLDGIEVYNGNASHNSRNDIAKLWANKFGLRQLSGSDCHTPWMASPGGIYLDELPRDETELAEMLLQNRYKLKRG